MLYCYSDAPLSLPNDPRPFTDTDYFENQQTCSTESYVFINTIAEFTVILSIKSVTVLIVLSL